MTWDKPREMTGVQAFTELTKLHSLEGRLEQVFMPYCNALISVSEPSYSADLWITG